MESADLSSPCILYIDETLEHGILGLVASKLCELLHRPVGVFTLDGESYVGSFRAPIGIDLIKILDTASSYLLRYGGHAGAAGCTISADSFPQAKEALLLATSQLYDMSSFTPVLAIDTVLDIEKIDHNFMQEIESLRPFGQSFDAPLFMLRDISHSLSPLGQTGQHFKWNIDIPGLDIIGFNLDDIISELSGNPLHLIGKLSARTWRDTTTLQFQVIDAVKA